MRVGRGASAGPGAGLEPMGADHDLALGIVDRSDREGGTILLGGKADCDGRPRGYRRGRQRGESAARASERTPESTREHQRARNRYVRVALTHPYRVGLLTKTASSATVPVRPSPYSGFRWAPGELRVRRCRIKRLPRWSRPSRWWKLEWSLRWPLIRPHEVEVLPDRRQPGR